MINKEIKFLMQKLNFCNEAQKELLTYLDLILKNPNYNDEFISVLKYYNDENFDFLKMLDDIKQLSLKVKINESTAYMLFLLALAPELHKKYLEKGYSDALFYDTLMDLNYKLEECRLVKGEIGTFVPKWYKGFFEMKIFALGRLQFEINYTWFDCDVKGKHIPKGTKVLSVHIPRTGTRLEHSAVIDSYQKAREFFKDEFDEIIFICNSWLLYPENRKILKDGSNLAQFYDDFTIVNSGEYQNYGEVWRLFDCQYDGNPDNLPNDSSLRRAYIERIKGNKPIGHGTGIII